MVKGGEFVNKKESFLLFRGNLYLCSRECLEFSDWSGAFFCGLGLVGRVGGPLEEFFNN